MTMWRIKRIQFIPVDQQTEECAHANNVTNVTLVDTDTSNESIVKVCWDADVDQCVGTDGLLGLLNSSGFTPADWDDYCDFE
jgi:hypothetical protein